MMDSTKLDNKDRRMLVALDNDATISLNNIASMLNTTKEVAAYRLKRLEERGIITNYIGIYHLAKVGLTHFKLYIKLAHTSPEKKREIVDFVLKEKNFRWLASSEGNYDIMIAVHFPSIFEFDQFKERLFTKFGEFFQRNSFAIMTEAEAYPRQYISGESSNSKIFSFCGHEKKEKLDLDDILILKSVSANSRASSVKMSEKIGLSDRVIRYRRKLLEKKGVIVGYKIVTDHKKLGCLFFKCLIKMRNADKKRLSDFRVYVRQHPNIIHWLKVLGEWDTELELEVSSISEFYGISNEIRNKFSDIISTFDSLLITEEHFTPQV